MLLPKYIGSYIEFAMWAIDNNLQLMGPTYIHIPGTCILRTSTLAHQMHINDEVEVEVLVLEIH